MIRTKIGKELFNNLIKNNLVEAKPIEQVKPGLSLLQKVATSKRNKCDKHIDSKLNDNLRVPNY